MSSKKRRVPFGVLNTGAWSKLSDRAGRLYLALWFIADPNDRAPRDAGDVRAMTASSLPPCRIEEDIQRLIKAGLVVDEGYLLYLRDPEDVRANRWPDGHRKSTADTAEEQREYSGDTPLDSGDTAEEQRAYTRRQVALSDINEIDHHTDPCVKVKDEVKVVVEDARARQRANPPPPPPPPPVNTPVQANPIGRPDPEPPDPLADLARTVADEMHAAGHGCRGDDVDPRRMGVLVGRYGRAEVEAAIHGLRVRKSSAHDVARFRVLEFVSELDQELEKRGRAASRRAANERPSNVFDFRRGATGERSAEAVFEPMGGVRWGEDPATGKWREERF